ncbi:hypothetical protein [Pelagibius sp.]|uniref:hypothetical protein n=1 Tax=Pelagibius sp. TaxID=1931238 RepID=UPI003B50EEBC
MKRSAYCVVFFAILVLVSLSYGISVSGQSLPLPTPPNTEKSDEIEDLIDSELFVGAPSEVIEAFFERHGIAYSFNEFGNRYQAIIRDVVPELQVVQSVVIRIDLDSEGRFAASDVGNDFTAR